MAFRQTAGRVLGVDPDAILIGNGSDDILTILTRAFVPEDGLVVSPTPSYLLYRTLAQLQGARFQTVPFTADGTCRIPGRAAGPSDAGRQSQLADRNHGRRRRSGKPGSQLQGPLVVDEAYVDFAESNALTLLRLGNVDHHADAEQVVFAGRAALRLRHRRRRELVRELNKVKDSYNCDALSLACAAAALEDQDYMRQTRARILSTRARLEKSLAGSRFRRAAQPGQLRLGPPRRPSGAADFRGTQDDGGFSFVT